MNTSRLNRRLLAILLGTALCVGAPGKLIAKQPVLATGAQAPVAENATSGQVRLVTIGSGSTGGVYFPAAGALCRLLNQQRVRHGIRCVLDASSGSVQNVQDLLSLRIDFGLVQTDVQADAVVGKGRFEGIGPQPRLRALFSVHAEPFTVISRLDANINGFPDLKGKRVNMGEAGSGTRATMDLVMQSFGLTEADFTKAHSMPDADAGAALCENRIDAYVYVVGHPNRTLRAVSESCAVRLVTVDGAPAQALLKSREYFAKTHLPGHMYVGNDAIVHTIGVRASVLTLASLPEKVAYELTRAVFDNLTDLRGLHPAFQNLVVKEMLSGNTAPIHPGALKYFNEKGLVVP